MGIMLGSLSAVAVVSALALDAGVGRPEAGADTSFSRHQKEEICRLVVLAAHKERVAPPHHTNLLAQPATSELAGEHGRIWMDVRVQEHGRSRYPLARGESCGDQQLVELCDWERLGNRCSRDRKDRERWRVVVLLDPWRLQAWLGHSTINMTMRYVHHVEEHHRPIPEGDPLGGRGGPRSGPARDRHAGRPLRRSPWQHRGNSAPVAQQHLIVSRT
jgi:hypothetical protein